MDVLYLGPARPQFEKQLALQGDHIMRWEEPLTMNLPWLPKVSLAVSYGYRHLIRPEVLARLTVVNLHISYLPWNRGADPNLWSYLEATPPGVSIHYVDAGLDTGPIIDQQFVTWRADDTLRSSYARLSVAVEELFLQHWGQIRNGSTHASPQVGTGTYHRIADRLSIEYLLREGWDTPVIDLLGQALKQN